MDAGKRRIMVFAAWETPFERIGDALDITQVRSDAGGRLTVDVLSRQTGQAHRVDFGEAAAYRVQDESGLTAIWQARAEQGFAGRVTFRVRDPGWARESPIPFLISDGWEYVLATDDTCVEVVTEAEPSITPLP